MKLGLSREAALVLFVSEILSLCGQEGRAAQTQPCLVPPGPVRGPGTSPCLLTSREWDHPRLFAASVKRKGFIHRWGCGSWSAMGFRLCNGITYFYNASNCCQGFCAARSPHLCLSCPSHLLGLAGQGVARAGLWAGRTSAGVPCGRYPRDARVRPLGCWTTCFPSWAKARSLCRALWALGERLWSAGALAPSEVAARRCKCWTLPIHLLALGLLVEPVLGSGGSGARAPVGRSLWDRQKCYLCLG